MILYNTLIGVLVGLSAFITASMLRSAAYQKKNYMGHGAALLVTGIPLTFLSAMMTVTWPLTANPPINIAFGEPALLVGILTTVVGALALRMRNWQLVTRPLTWVVGGLGAILASISLAIFHFDLVGDAPAAEPITGSVTGWENTTFGIAYAVAAIACLAFLWLRTKLGTAVAYYGLIVSGIFFFAFSVLNYYTHIGLLLNLSRGTA